MLHFLIWVLVKGVYSLFEHFLTCIWFVFMKYFNKMITLKQIGGPSGPCSWSPCSHSSALMRLQLLDQRHCQCIVSPENLPPDTSTRVSHFLIICHWYLKKTRNFGDPQLLALGRKEFSPPTTAAPVASPPNCYLCLELIYPWWRGLTTLRGSFHSRKSFLAWALGNPLETHCFDSVF